MKSGQLPIKRCMDCLLYNIQINSMRQAYFGGKKIFLEEKGFILRNTENNFLPGFEPQIHGLRGELSTAKLFDLRAYQVLIYLFTYHLSVCTHTDTKQAFFNITICTRHQ